MDETLKDLLDELVKAEDEMAQMDGSELEPDPEDRFYTAACHVVYRWAELNKPKTERPNQTGIKFTLNEDGSAGMEDV